MGGGEGGGGGPLWIWERPIARRPHRRRPSRHWRWQEWRGAARSGQETATAEAEPPTCVRAGEASGAVPGGVGDGAAEEQPIRGGGGFVGVLLVPVHPKGSIAAAGPLPPTLDGTGIRGKGNTGRKGLKAATASTARTMTRRRRGRGGVVGWSSDGPPSTRAGVGADDAVEVRGRGR
jgi:hypothetical protein